MKFSRLLFQTRAHYLGLENGGPGKFQDGKFVSLENDIQEKIVEPFLSISSFSGSSGY